MWYGRGNFLCKSEFGKMMDKKKKEKEGNSGGQSKFGKSEDFKIALVAMLFFEDYETLESRFLKV